MITASPSQKFQLAIQLTDGNTTRFIEAIIFDKLRNIVDTKILTHLSKGFYSDEVSIDDVGAYSAQIIVYTDNTMAAVVSNSRFLENIMIRTDNALGHGSKLVTYTVKDDQGNPLAGVVTFVTSDPLGTVIVAGSKITDSNGVVTFLLDPGVTYFIWNTKLGFNFNNPDIEVFD